MINKPRITSIKWKPGEGAWFVHPPASSAWNEYLSLKNSPSIILSRCSETVWKSFFKSKYNSLRFFIIEGNNLENHKHLCSHPSFAHLCSLKIIFLNPHLCFLTRSLRVALMLASLDTPAYCPVLLSYTMLFVWFGLIWFDLVWFGLVCLFTSSTLWKLSIMLTLFSSTWEIRFMI